MAEYWKSTPRYWCKYCSTYVRDTKLERQNHDATAKHQSAIKRSLRDLHRGKEREERDKERAKREIDRLNGLVPSSAPAGPSSSRGGAGRGGGGGVLGETERKRQVEQLASLGVKIPDQFRGDLAMAGEWTVTSTTVVPVKKENDNDSNPDAIARGVHKRERTEEELEQEEAAKGLFKKPRRWGRDSKTTGTAGGGDCEDGDLDALLSGGLVVKTKETKEDEGDGLVKKEEDVAKKEEGQDLPPPSPPHSIKKEPSDNDDDAPPISNQLPARAEDDDKPAGAPPPPPPTKTEHDGAEGGASAPAVVFKKRKPKNIRRK